MHNGYKRSLSEYPLRPAKWVLPHWVRSRLHNLLLLDPLFVRRWNPYLFDAESPICSTRNPLFVWRWITYLFNPNAHPLRVDAVFDNPLSWKLSLTWSCAWKSWYLITSSLFEWIHACIFQYNYVLMHGCQLCRLFLMMQYNYFLMAYIYLFIHACIMHYNYLVCMDIISRHLPVCASTHFPSWQFKSIGAINSQDGHGWMCLIGPKYNK